MSTILTKLSDKILPDSLKRELKIIRMRWWLRSRIISDWKNAGKPVPPPHAVKQVVIESYQRQSKYEILVETGTYLGHMVEAQRKYFKEIFSIELSKELWKSAIEKFKKYPHIKILQGDSAKVLKTVTTKLNSPAIFWLDGHYSGGITAKGDTDCPIYEEIDAIFDGVKLDHIILIDDARLFINEGDYPSVSDLTVYVQKKDPRYKLALDSDIIRYTIN